MNAQELRNISDKVNRKENNINDYVLEFKNRMFDLAKKGYTKYVISCRSIPDYVCLNIDEFINILKKDGFIVKYEIPEGKFFHKLTISW